MILNKLILAAVATFSTASVLCDIQGEFEQQHMHDTHQIEVTDEVTFFKLHDLDGDGFWDESELQSMYGLERDIDPNANHIKLIIDRVYQDMDLNRDRFISQDEYITHKLPSLSKIEEKQEEGWKEEDKKKKKKKKKKKDEEKVIVQVNNKRKPSAKKVAPDSDAVKVNIFKQEGVNYVPNKYRV